MAEKAKEMVNHPQHYQSCSLECIEMMEILFGEAETANFCIANAFKYLWRYESKNGAEDVNKAEWYLNYADRLSYYFSDEMALIHHRLQTKVHQAKIKLGLAEPDLH